MSFPRFCADANKTKAELGQHLSYSISSASFPPQLDARDQEFIFVVMIHGSMILGWIQVEDHVCVCSIAWFKDLHDGLGRAAPHDNTPVQMRRAPAAWTIIREVMVHASTYSTCLSCITENRVSEMDRPSTC